LNILPINNVASPASKTASHKLTPTWNKERERERERKTGREREREREKGRKTERKNIFQGNGEITDI
jgi:hypothetical protein